VCAIVLTYAAPDALARCLEALVTQSRLPDTILVVDNASPIPAHVGDLAVPCTVVRAETNSGPAGGHALGLECFLTSDADVAWVMDDDCVADPGCLEHLLEALADAPSDAIALPWWIDVITGGGQFCPAWCGFVVPREVVETVGLPRADLVWWTEDTEYIRHRMDRAGVVTLTPSDAVVEHRRVRNAGPRPVWKVYYETRNTIYYRMSVQPGKLTFRTHRMLRALGRLLAQVVVEGDRRSLKLAAFARGVSDGLRRKLGLRVSLDA
jgi:GT2 family glycosyltransferase